MRNVRLNLPLIYTTLWHSDYECNAELRAKFFHIDGIRL